jgi:exopolyphosphatase/pppGpp-phosphohydrolase
MGRAGDILAKIKAQGGRSLGYSPWLRLKRAVHISKGCQILAAFFALFAQNTARINDAHIRTGYTWRQIGV